MVVDTAPVWLSPLRRVQMSSDRHGPQQSLRPLCAIFAAPVTAHRREISSAAHPPEQLHCLVFRQGSCGAGSANCSE